MKAKQTEEKDLKEDSLLRKYPRHALALSSSIIPHSWVHIHTDDRGHMYLHVYYSIYTLHVSSCIL